MNPYLITGPAVISFSGGRTSGYMLWEILRAHGGRLPSDVHVVFANTGLERTETLDFVHQCGIRWNVDIAWVEYRYQDGKHTFERVSHNSASRAGEPFSELIRNRKATPNTVQRYCTQELKVRILKKYMVAVGHAGWLNVVGLRADEPGRVARLLDPERRRERWTNATPLSTAGVTEDDVLAFWGRQDFDLQLRSYEGNCDLCFLKAIGKITRIMRENPQLAQWWIGVEEPRIAEAKRKGALITLEHAPTEVPDMNEDEIAALPEGAVAPMRTTSSVERNNWVQDERQRLINGAKFRIDRPSYRELLDQTMRDGPLLFDLIDDSSSCDSTCTDQEPTSDLYNLRKMK